MKFTFVSSTKQHYELTIKDDKPCEVYHCESDTFCLLEVDQEGVHQWRCEQLLGPDSFRIYCSRMSFQSRDLIVKAYELVPSLLSLTEAKS